MTPDWTLPPRPHAIAHRGASAYAPDNTLAAFRKAAELGAAMWEADLRLTADGVVVAHHDATLPDGTAIAALSLAQLQSRSDAPTLDAILDLAQQCGAALYADIKDLGATLPTLDALRARGIERAILGAFSPEAARMLAEAGCPYPRAALVPLGADPFAHAAGADVVHLCWERMARPQDSLTQTFFERAFAAGQRVVLWHEEDPARMAELRGLPVTGICSDTPELVAPFRPPADWPLEIVAHRGANRIAPENTLPALACALRAGFRAETDLRVTSDGAIVAIHDPTLDRTTDGRGLVHDTTLESLRARDAGAWFEPFFAGTQVPTLAEVLDTARALGGSLYLELKTAPPEPVWDAAAAAGLAERCFFWSFDMALLRRLRSHAPAAQIMIRRQDHPSLAAALATLAPAIVEFTPDEDAGEIASLRGSAVRAMVAYMGGDPAVFDRIVALRPDLVNLDRPFHFARHIRGRAGA